MSNIYPFYTENTHDQGNGLTTSAANAARDTAISKAEGRLVVDALDKIFLLEANKHPLTTLLTNVGKTLDGKSYKGAGIMKSSCTQSEFTCFEDVYGGRYAKVAVAYDAATDPLTMTVTGAGSSSAYIFTVGDIIKNGRTGENMRVTAIAGANTITVSRAWGTTPITAGVSGDGIFIVGNVNAEGSGARNVNATRVNKVTNYTQIFKKTVAVTGTENASKLYGGKDLPYQRAKMAVEHAMDIERAFWFGEKKETTDATTGKPVRSTGGILEFLTSGNSYVHNQNGVLTAPDFNSYLREAFTYGSDRKVLFAGGNLIQAINEISRGQLTTNVGDTTYGLKISNWMTPFGEIRVVHNPLFIGEYATYGFLLDLDGESFQYKYLDGRDTKLEMNIQANDADLEADQYITECGLFRAQAPRHSIIKGVVA